MVGTSPPRYHIRVAATAVPSTAATAMSSSPACPGVLSSRSGTPSRMTCRNSPICRCCAHLARVTTSIADYGACDHLDCHRGPFLIVFLDADDVKMRVHLYSSEDGTWSEPSYGPPSTKYGIERVPTALAGNALCFLIDATNSILKYDLATRNVSVIHLPPYFISDFAVLTTMGDGGLGFARVEKSRLWICSKETDPKGDEFWVPVRSIELETLLQVDAHSIINDCVVFAHGVEVFFVGTEDGWFSIDLKSGRVREEEYGDGWTHGVVPYMSFYTPNLHQYGVVPV